jgi:hypothetical protein
MAATARNVCCFRYVDENLWSIGGKHVAFRMDTDYECT